MGDSQVCNNQKYVTAYHVTATYYNSLHQTSVISTYVTTKYMTTVYYDNPILILPNSYLNSVRHGWTFSGIRKKYIC